MVTGRPRGDSRLSLLRRVLLTVGVLGALAVLAGCGGQAEAVRDAGRYADAVNRVQSRFEADLRKLDAAANRADVRADVDRAVRRLGARIAQVERELHRITPPPSVARPHAALIAAFRRWKAPLDAFRRALRDRDRSATLRAKTEFSTATAAVEDQVNDARRRINDGLRQLAD